MNSRRIVEDEEEDSSIRANIEEMMDVDFPLIINSAVDDDDDGGKDDNDTEQDDKIHAVPMIDILRDGWDDNAVTRCLELAISFHNGDDRITKDSLEFHPMPNNRKRYDEKNVKSSSTPGDQIDNHNNSNNNVEQIHQIKSKNQNNKQTWEPMTLMMPKWAEPKI